jgi:excisionase family DNA binding protein
LSGPRTVRLDLEPAQARVVLDLLLVGGKANILATRANGISAWRAPEWLVEVCRTLMDGAAAVSPDTAASFASARSAHAYTTAHAADVLGISVQAVRGLAARGTLPAWRTGDRCASWRLDGLAVDQRAARRR